MATQMIAEWYWRLFSAWHALFEAPTRAETIEHCALEAHKRQEELADRYQMGYWTGYADATASMQQQKELV